MKKNCKPSWWLLNGLMIGMIATLFLAQKMAPTTSLRMLTQIGIVIFGYWLGWRWVSANAAALEQEEEKRQKQLEERLRQVETNKSLELKSQTLNPQQTHYLKATTSRKQ